jgi:hypothetical protein
MRRRPSPLVRDAVTTLAQLGHAASLESSGKHYKVSWVAGGKRRALTIAKTPGDRRARANSLAVLRRLLRESETEARP